MRAVGNRTSWVRFGILENATLMCKDYICYGTGCHITFLNLNTKETTIFTANFSSANGDGVRVVEGHKSSYTFAYAEYSLNAAIYVKDFPDFETIFTFRNGPPDGYSNIAFSDTSLLLALGELPHNNLYIFNWRTGERLGEMKSDITFDEQILKCNWSRPNLLAQLGKNSREVCVWDLFCCCNSTVTRKHEVKTEKHNVPPFTDMIWTSECTLFLVDTEGSIYMCDIDFELIKVIESDISGNGPTCLTWYKAGLTLTGPDTCIRHYKKLDTWICDWIIDLQVKIRKILFNRSEYIIGITVEEEIVKISNVDGIDFVQTQQSKFSDFCLIYPTANHVVILSQNTYLNVVGVENGLWVSTYPLNGHALCVTENPEYPYVAVCYNDGRLELISAFNANELESLITFNLCSEALTSVKFFEAGKIIVTGNLFRGFFFILQGLAGTKINVVAHIDVGKQIVDYILIGARHCHRLFVIPVTSKYLASNKIIRYCIIDEDNISKKEYHAEREDALYYRLIATNKPNRDRVFYALCFTSRNIHVLEIRRGDSTARVISEIKTGHQMKKFDLRLTGRHALTWGFDGFIIARCNQFEKNIGMVLPHHRLYGGVKKAYMDVSGKFVISLGREEILTCTDLVDNIFDELCMKQSCMLMVSPKFLIMFKRPTLGFETDRRFQGKSWLEIKNIEKNEIEEKLCRDEKQSILSELNQIRDVVKSMVTKNLNGPENEKIDLLEFYLDKDSYTQKKTQNKVECRETEIYMKQLIVAQDEVTNHLKNNYLRKMAVPSRIIRGIFQKTMATSYCLLPPEPGVDKLLLLVEELRKVEQYLFIRGGFEPWHAISKTDLLKHLKSPMNLIAQDYVGILRRMADESYINQMSTETQIALIGTISQLYIDRNPAHYRQEAMTTFMQCDVQQSIVNADVIKLKVEYNKKFQQTLEEKYRVIDSIKHKNARMRHIISEYNYFSTDKVFIDIVDPEWTQEEEPWLLETVDDSEINITPYISPSEQAILDAKAAEDERIRLALLADDFRERALMAMMNGVLEVKWEDELKKEVPVPKCMLKKDPAQFNEEDLRLIKEYEDKVAFLNSERERYKILLDIEYGKLALSLKDSIGKFNEKIRDAVSVKTDMDSAVNQENLIVTRARKQQTERVISFQKERQIKRQIVENEAAVAEINESIREINEIQKECKTQADLYIAKDKILEKQFRRDFLEASLVVQEQAAKLYKKRPKATFRNINASSVLFELAKCITTGENSRLLTPETLEYVKSLELLDHFVGLPPTIDENTFNLICKHRRQRIEYEVRSRAHQIQLLNGDAAIATFQKRVANTKENITRLQNDLKTIRKEYLELMHNIEIQIVLRRGLVELPLTGDISDFNDAILVPKQEIEDINSRIRAVGQKKMSTIIKNMAFRRNIMATEYEHQKMRMTINDYIEHIYDIETVKFTREMQQYLISKERGRKQESYEQEIEVLTTCFEHALRDKKYKYNKLTRDLKAYKEQNNILDKSIQNINIDVCHLKLQEDTELQKKENYIDEERMKTLLKRSNLIHQIQQNHNEILVLQTELELLRLKTYPTFKYKLLNPSD